MGTDGTHRYLLWADDALVRGESLYALLNKLAWFAGRGALQLIRDLKATQATPSPSSPQRIDFYSTLDDTWMSIVRLPEMPEIHGLRFREYVTKAGCGAPVGFGHRIYNVLRYCPDCISVGMHFDVTQLDVVEYCPHHSKVITSHCFNCGQDVPYACVTNQDPFSCGSCNSSLLRSDLTNLRSNHADRRRVAETHEQLVRKLLAAPDLLSFGNGHYRVGHVQSAAVKHIMTRLLDGVPAGRSLPLTVSVPYVAVKVVRNEKGRACLKRVTEIALEPRHDPNRRNLRVEIELAQLRVGAWALRHFRGHLSCICAGREEIKGHGSHRSDSWIRTSSYACCIGMAFAAWEAGRSARAIDEPSLSLWENLNLDDRSHRTFAFYILEKACLVGAIMPFINNDRHSLREWQMKEFVLRLTGSDYVEENRDQALIWLDVNQLDLDECCDLHFRDRKVQVDWLDKVIGELQDAREQPEVHMAAEDLMLDLSSRYGADSRLAVGSKWMHDEINRRVRYVIKSASD